MYLITDKRRASRRDRDWRAATGVRVNSEFAKGIASVWVPDPPDRLKNLVDPRFPFVNGNIYGGVSQPMTWTRLPQAVSGHGWLGGSQKVMTVPNGTTDSLIDPLNVWEPPHRGVAEARSQFVAPGPHAVDPRADSQGIRVRHGIVRVTRGQTLFGPLAPHRLQRRAGKRGSRVIHIARCVQAVQLSNIAEMPPTE